MTADRAIPVPELVGTPPPGRPPPATRRPDLVGLVVVGTAGLLPVVRFDELYYTTWAPKAALCLVLLPVGLLALGKLVAAGDRRAWLAAAFLGSAAGSTALSDRPVLSLVGSVNWGTGLLFLAVLCGCWALGSTLGERRRRHLVAVIIAASLANAAVAWGQARLGDGGRTFGLMGNPVFLGALAAGGLYLVAHRVVVEHRSRWWLPACGLLAGAAQLSGSRAAVALAVVVVLGVVVQGVRAGVGAALLGGLLVAVTAGVLVAPIGATATALGSARVVPSGGAGDSSARLAVWRLTPGVVGERPLLGWGPGRFAAATGPRYTPAAAREGVVLRDGHNWVLHTAVTTGLAGLVLLLGWLWAAGRGARGPLAGFALVVCGASLFQPLHVALTPLGMLALGAAGAGRGSSQGQGTSRRWSTAGSLAILLGAAAAGVLVAGQLLLQQGVQGTDVGLIERADSLSPPWPELATKAADGEAELGLDLGEPHRGRTLAASREAARRDPADPQLWSELGAIELRWGTSAGAESAFRRALRANPWDARAITGQVLLASRRGDRAALVEVCRRLQQVDRSTALCGRAGP